MFELVTALRLAEPAVAAALADRFRPEIARMIAGPLSMPEDAVLRVLAMWDGADIAAVALGGSKGPLATELLVDVARLGEPATAAELFRRRGHLDARVADAVLESFKDPLDEGWYEQYGLVDQLREALAVDPMAAAVFPYAALSWTAAADACPLVPYAAAVDLCSIVADRGGPRDLRRLADKDLGHPGLADLLRQAADAESPSAFLAAARPPGEWSDPLAAREFGRVRGAEGGWGYRNLEHPPLDWSLVRAEHARRPLGDASLAWLATWQDIPADLFAQACAGEYGHVARKVGPITPDALTAPELVDRTDDFAALVARGLEEGRLTTDDVLAKASPAARMLTALPDTEQVTEALRALFTPFGTTPRHWLTWYARVARSRVGAREFVDEVLADPKPVTAWPRPLDAVFPAHEPEHTRALFLRVLRAMPDEVTIALAPHLDLRSVQHLLVFHGVPAEVRDALVAAHGVAALVAHASHYTLDEATVRWLLEHDEPAVNAMVFAHCRLDDAERARIFAGIRTDGVREPVGAEVLAELEQLNLGHYRARATLGLSGGDAGVAEVIVGRLRLGTEGGRLRLLAAVWERHGAEAVGTLLDPKRLTAGTVKTVTAALDAPDGLERIRARLAAVEAPDAVVAFLGKRSRDARDRLRGAVQEGLRMPWPELAAALPDGRLPADMVVALLELPDCTTEFARVALRDQQALDALPSGRGGDWRRTLLADGVLSPGELLRTASCPDRLIHRIAVDPRGSRQLLVDEPCEDARALVGEHLGDDAEAWTVALRLFAGFTGTFPELLATARAAVS